ncbi:hypothetical protein [Phenylobacterium sp.]|uniref:hypothetical protein n=1 Tax=Phenylobacterium sp. TaxID=1871053 RepID=UPI0028110A56|nr:hypothetical protein [Phenylobacterium sp.]
MARRPDEDPRVTDLRRYKKAREQAKRRPPPRPPARKEGILGSNPRAGLILAIAAAVLFALWVLPVLL